MSASNQLFNALSEGSVSTFYRDQIDIFTVIFQPVGGGTSGDYFTCHCGIYKIGTQMYFSMRTITNPTSPTSSTWSSFTSAVGIVPEQYRPNIEQDFVWPTSNYTGSAYNACRLVLSTAGTITLFQNGAPDVNFVNGAIIGYRVAYYPLVLS